MEDMFYNSKFKPNIDNWNLSDEQKEKLY